MAGHGVGDLLHRDPTEVPGAGVTLQIGLGIGRLVFRALNACELALAAVVAACFANTPPPTGSAIAAAVAVVTLVAPVLAVLAGGEGPRSHAHWVYVGLEVVKVVALLIAGISLLAS